MNAGQESGMSQIRDPNSGRSARVVIEHGMPRSLASDDPAENRVSRTRSGPQETWMPPLMSYVAAVMKPASGPSR